MVVLPRARNRGWRSAGIACLGLVAASWPAAALAHDVSEQAKLRLLNGHWLDVIWIGAEHMLTGYDHLLFLLGVLFFLTSARQIVYFVTAFTFGHTLTLLFATLAGITANAYLVDAVIALTVCYKAFENLGGFRRYLGIEAPNLLFMVFVFGLIHGFGLSTRLQQMTLVDDPYLVAKILGFNVGVEVGQIAALLVMGAIVALWRETPAWRGVARTANVVLLLCGAALCAWQIAAYQDAAAQGAALDDNGPTREREFASQ